jgi:hypothetical protein
MVFRIFAAFPADRSRDISGRRKACSTLLPHYPKNDIERRKQLLHWARTGVYPHQSNHGAELLHTQGHSPMLFIFSKPNFVQIAWNSRAPESQSRVRNAVMPAPFGPLGFIRTRSIG